METRTRERPGSEARLSSREFRYRWRWELPASAEALWPLVSDTDRFNRDAGLPPVEDARAPGEELQVGRRKLRIRVKGVLLEWEELPFEWFRPWRFGVVRRYTRGPLREMRVRAELEPGDHDGTVLTYEVAALPRGLFGLLTTPIQIGLISRITFGRTFRRYAASIARSGPEAPGKPLPARAADLVRRLLAAGLEGPVARRLAEHLVSADDMTLGRLRPYELADLWGHPRREVLNACLVATRAGVLDLEWDVLCPSCRGAKVEAETLRNLRLGDVHCDDCRIDFSPDFDQSVELTFHPNHAVRSVTVAPFCVAGPQVTPHIEVQQRLAPGEAREVRPRLTEGRHRIRVIGTPATASFLLDPEGPERATVTLQDGVWRDAPLTLAPDAVIGLVNATDAEQVVRIERTAWGDTSVTAAEVTALPEFRDLFSSEVLAEGAFARVGSVAILFTDLRDSTALYTRVGDAPAFGRVMRHFRVLEEAVHRHGGAVVKTIGDAVMAVFPDMVGALDAALDAQDALAHPLDGAEPLTLKAGVHFGPAIVVTLNDRLDYFGTTVNMGARLGGLSSGEDVVVSERVRRDPRVQALFERRGTSVSNHFSDIRGLDDRVPVWRVRSPRAGS